MQHFWLLFVASLLASVCGDLSQSKHHRKKHVDKKHHAHHHHGKHGHHKHHHHEHHDHGTPVKAPAPKMAAVATKTVTKSKVELGKGQLDVNGPLPKDFAKRFAEGVAKATGCDPAAVQVLKSSAVAGGEGLASVEFQAPRNVVSLVQSQAGDETSKLANGPLRLFLIAKDVDTDAAATAANTKACGPGEEPSKDGCTPEMPETPVTEKGIDIDTAMPYGDLEPFGREDTAQELTESSVKESDEMVDQLERAEVAEEKRAVFRALTRLRGAAITSFDGVARSQTGNIDEYNKVHKWRSTHPLHHLADEESDITKWAFPDNADF